MGNAYELLNAKGIHGIHSIHKIGKKLIMKPLSPRECQVVEFLVGGLTQKEVADQLGISPCTVRCYLLRIKVKTQQPTVLSAVAFVLIHGMVLPSSV